MLKIPKMIAFTWLMWSGIQPSLDSSMMEAKVDSKLIIVAFFVSVFLCLENDGLRIDSAAWLCCLSILFSADAKLLCEARLINPCYSYCCGSNRRQALAGWTTQAISQQWRIFYLNWGRNWNYCCKSFVLSTQYSWNCPFPSWSIWW